MVMMVVGCKSYDDLALTDGGSGSDPEDTAVQIVIPPVVDTSDTDTSVEPPVPISIAGTWVDPFDVAYVFDLDSLTVTAPNDTSVFHLLEWSDTDQWVVARNDSANRIFPDRFSRYEWVFFHDDLYLCLVTGVADTEPEALNAGPADSSDPRAGGCDFSPWLELLPKG